MEIHLTLLLCSANPALPTWSGSYLFLGTRLPRPSTDERVPNRNAPWTMFSLAFSAVI